MLLAEAENDAVSFICVGRTGKGALQNALEGSVSRRFTKLSPVPVVTVG
jgi:nucleotide-binding universal stress UspA family protein